MVGQTCRSYITLADLELLNVSQRLVRLPSICWEAPEQTKITFYKAARALFPPLDKLLDQIERFQISIISEI